MEPTTETESTGDVTGIEVGLDGSPIAGSGAGGPGDDGEVRADLGPFGPPTWTRALILAVAFAFLGGAVGWVIGDHGDDDPFNAVDVGFMQDMTVHHTQAIQMSKILLFKNDIDRDLRAFAEEFLGDQRFDQGVFNAWLARAGHPVSNPDETAMGWMGPAVPALEMAGMATDEQMQELRDAEGAEAESLFIALMSEHHLGGLHMADYQVRHGHDLALTNFARGMLKIQRDEIADLARARSRLDLPFPDGFTDPLKDQRLNPLSLNED